MNKLKNLAKIGLGIGLSTAAMAGASGCYSFIDESGRIIARDIFGTPPNTGYNLGMRINNRVFTHTGWKGDLDNTAQYYTEEFIDFGKDTFSLSEAKNSMRRIYVGGIINDNGIHPERNYHRFELYDSKGNLLRREDHVIQYMDVQWFNYDVTDNVKPGDIYTAVCYRRYDNRDDRSYQYGKIQFMVKD